MEMMIALLVGICFNLVVDNETDVRTPTEPSRNETAPEMINGTPIKATQSAQN